MNYELHFIFIYVLARVGVATRSREQPREKLKSHNKVKKNEIIFSFRWISTAIWKTQNCWIALNLD